MALSFTGDFTEPKFQVGTGSFCLVLNKLVDSSRPFCSAMPTKSLTPLPFPSFQTLYFVVLPTRQQDSSICQPTTLNTTAQLSPPPWLSLQRQAVQTRCIQHWSFFPACVLTSTHTIPLLGHFSNFLIPRVS